MKKKVLIVDTSILCVWLKVLGKEECGNSNDKWNYARVEKYIQDEISNNSTLVLPIASIIETGNHISQMNSKRREIALELANMMKKAANEESPWAAFGGESELWEAKKLIGLANEWPDLAAQKLSIGDTTIKNVAEYYAKAGFEVEILTGDDGLRAYSPSAIASTPRRRK